MSYRLEIQKIIDRYDITNFTIDKITRGWEVPKELIQNIVPTLRVLQALRTHLDRAVVISGTYRDELYNQAVKGRPNSLHLFNNAIDFTIVEKNYVKKAYQLWTIYKVLDSWDRQGHFDFLGKGKMGLGRYNTFIHIDTRGTLNRPSPARW